MTYDEFSRQLREHMQDADFGRTVVAKFIASGSTLDSTVDTLFAQDFLDDHQTATQDCIIVYLAQSSDPFHEDEVKIWGFGIDAAHLYDLYLDDGWDAVTEELKTMLQRGQAASPEYCDTVMLPEEEIADIRMDMGGVEPGAIYDAPEPNQLPNEEDLDPYSRRIYDLGAETVFLPAVEQDIALAVVGVVGCVMTEKERITMLYRVLKRNGYQVKRGEDMIYHDVPSSDKVDVGTLEDLLLYEKEDLIGADVLDREKTPQALQDLIASVNHIAAGKMSWPMERWTREYYAALLHE